MKQRGKMPGYRTHLIGGALVFVPLYVITTNTNPSIQPIHSWALLGSTLLGALIPDLDVTSKIQRFFYICIAGLFIGSLLLHKTILLTATATIGLIVGCLKHRTIMHNPLFLAAIPLPAIYIISKHGYYSETMNLIALFFISGAWSHVLLDRVCTKKTRK